MRFAIHEREAQVPGYAYEGSVSHDDLVPSAGDIVEIAGEYAFRVIGRRFCYDVEGGPLLLIDVTSLPKG